jgi:hypothetical protein
MCELISTCRGVLIRRLAYSIGLKPSEWPSGHAGALCVTARAAGRFVGACLTIERTAKTNGLGVVWSIYFLISRYSPGDGPRSSSDTTCTHLPRCFSKINIRNLRALVSLSLSRTTYWSHVDRGWSMKRSSILPVVLFASVLTGLVWANDQQTQQACVNAAICVLAVRSGLSPDRRSDLQLHYASLACAVAWSGWRVCVPFSKG